MKKIKNKITIFIMLIMILCTSGIYVINQVKASSGVGSTEDKSTDVVTTNKDDTTIQTNHIILPDGAQLVNKDETVYVNLNYDGSVSKINVVNFFKVQQAGTYQDFGSYDNIVNLTNDVKPNADGNSIRWELTGPTANFYYQGQLSNGELPWEFTMEYKLNGVVQKASDLPGAVGELAISISVEENKSAEEYFRQNYMMQITIPLNMQNSTLISAPGAVQMIAGHTKTLAFTVLPGTSNRFEIKAEVQDFAMDAIDIAMMKADMSSYMDVGEMTEGFGTMSEGMEELANGTVELKDGITELSGGISTLGNGINELSLGTPRLSKGMDQFDDGLKTFAGGLERLTSGSEQMKEGMNGLAQTGKQLLSGYQDIEDGVSSLLTMKQELSTMAGKMAKSSDPQTVMLAQALLGQLEGMSSLQSGIENLNNNLDQYTQGVQQVAGKYDTLNAGIKALPVGFGQITGGYKDIKNGNKAVYSAVDELSKGLSDIDAATVTIPEQIQLLADGQLAMKDGIDQAAEEIAALAGISSSQDKIQSVSFAAPGKITPNSVQFVLRTPAIEKASKPAGSVEIEADEKSFWDKLVDLF